MSNKQLLTFLEALKIIVINSSDRENILQAIEQMQNKLKEQKSALGEITTPHRESRTRCGGTPTAAAILYYNTVGIKNQEVLKKWNL